MEGRSESKAERGEEGGVSESKAERGGGGGRRSE